MNVTISYANDTAVKAAVRNIKIRIADENPAVVIYFASPVYDPIELSSEMACQFPSATVFGCSTAGEIISGKMLKQSIVAMAFGKDMFDDVQVEVVRNLADTSGVETAFRNFGERFGESMANLDYKKYVGIILVDGLSGAEERLMDRIGDLTNVTFVGGSAGDDMKFERTFVYADGKAYTGAAVLALIKPKNGFDVIKTQSFCSTNKKLVATKVNAEAREVLEFNGKPAIQEYADVLDTTVEDAQHHFMTNPVGVMFDEEPYVRSPQRVIGDRMVFFCNILEGMELSLLSSTSIIEDTKKAIEDKKKELGSLAAIINFNCILRTQELEGVGATEEYAALFSDIPTIGFSTYGEEFIGHINQTATMLVFR